VLQRTKKSFAALPAFTARHGRTIINVSKNTATKNKGEKKAPA
jgi:aspartate carbamoyltransferase catalytic subunit